MNKTGRICIAMMCAFFVGSIASTVLAAAPDGDGMTLDQYEHLFGLDLTNPANATLDYDGDGLSNLQESFRLTDPFRADTDDDGWPDAVDNAVSRARLDFHPLFTDGGFLRYAWPAWMVSVFKAGGAWDTSLPAWYVPAGTSGKLCLILDRSVLTNDVIIELEFYDAPNASLFVDLVNGNKEVLISSELQGNLVDGSGEIVRKAMNISLESYPEAVGIHLRGTGELFLFEGLLFVDRDNDGLDADQEAILGTSDLMLDSDGDGIADYHEVFVYGTNPAVPDMAVPTFSGDKDIQDQSGRQADTAAHPTVPRLNPAKRETSPQAFQTTRIKSATISQWLLAGMGGANFIMSRDTLSGGGTRQTSINFIMEDTVAQPSAIGFSTGSVIMLHAGYQQSDECILPEILNVGVIPGRFNPELGEIATLSYVLNVDSPSVTIEVWKGLVTNTVVSAQYQPAGLNALTWLGTNEDGTLVTPGPWSFTITAACNGQTTSAVAQVAVVKNIPVILTVDDEPDIFCPTQGVARIYYTTDEKNDKDLDVVRISLEDVEGNLVTEITYDDQPVGTYTQEWDGSDTPNFGTGTNYQPNGLYIYRINASRGGQQANEKTGVIVLACDTVATNVDNLVGLRYRPDSFTVEITRPTGSQLTDANFALITADPSLFRQSPIYEIKANPETTFDPPAILTFKYSSAIIGDIDEKLQIRRYDPVTDEWVVIANQAVDFASNQVVAEITHLSFYALFSSEVGAPLIEMRASVRLKPEALKVNPSILTAFVSLPEGYPESGIIAATCDGAACESMMLNDDATEMAIKFRRQAIEEALAQQGEDIDTHFIVELTWQGDAGTFIFQGEDDITKIVN